MPCHAMPCHAMPCHAKHEALRLQACVNRPCRYRFKCNRTVTLLTICRIQAVQTWRCWPTVVRTAASLTSLGSLYLMSHPVPTIAGLCHLICCLCSVRAASMRGIRSRSRLKSSGKGGQRTPP